jgi:RNA polymerase sigma-70 factor (ECF subfamily)
MTADIQIQKQLVQFQSMLHAFAYKLTGDFTDAQDLYQDTAFKVLKNADKFKQGTNFKAWSSTIMRNIFINDYRKKKRRGVITDATDNDYYINSGAEVVVNSGERDLRFDEVYELVKELPENLKEPFLMSYNGFKYDEIAEQLDAPLGTIKSRIFFARKSLRERYLQLNGSRN